MKKIKYLFEKLHRFVIGEYRWAVKHGMKAGKGCIFPNSTHFGSEPYLLKFGDRVKCSFDVVFLTHDGGTWAFRREEGYKGVVKFAPVVVDDDTFIGARAIIMPGVHIGKNCVIGAGSIVTKDVPDGCVYAGTPAKFICTTKEYAEKSKNSIPDGFDLAEYRKDKRGYLERMFYDELN